MTERRLTTAGIIGLVLCLLACLSASGCATTNVRAIRAYAYEDADFIVALDRVESISEALRLIDVMMMGTPYSPGDPWIGELGLTDQRAEEIKASILKEPPYDSGDFHIGVVQLYRVHLTEVLGRAKGKLKTGDEAKDAAKDDAAKDDAAKDDAAKDDAAKDDAAKDDAAKGGEAKDADGDSDAGGRDPGEGAGDEPEQAAPADQGGEDAKGDEDSSEQEPKQPRKSTGGGEEEADYPSLLEAMKDLARGGDLREQWQWYRDSLAELDVAEEELSAVRARYQQINIQNPPQDYVEAQEKRKQAENKVTAAKQQIANILAEVKQANLKTGPRAQIARDMLAAFSVVLRIDLEALALIPFTIVQLARSLPDAPQALAEDIKKRISLESVGQIAELPSHAKAIKTRLQRQLVIVEAAVEALTSLTTTELVATAGFNLEQSVVDQIVGVTLDSFYANLEVDGEGFFFHQLGGDESKTTTESSDGKTTTTDLTGRTKRLVYAVEPIWMLGVKFNVGFDFIKLPGFANLNAGFATDRAWSSGGEIETGSSLAKELGITGIASDLLDLGLALVGIKTEVKLATFTTGQVQEIDVSATSGEDEGIARDADGKARVAPLQLTYKQIDVGYDIAWLFPDTMRPLYIEEVWLGYRYFDYQLPRVLYELAVDASGNKSFLDESPPQRMSSTYHMGGFRFRMGPGGAPIFHPYGDLGFYVGGGPTAYYFLKDNTQPNVRENRDVFAGGAGAFNFNIGLGTRFRLTPKQWPVRVHAGVQWRGEFVLGTISQDQEGSEDNTNVDLGSSEFFHGVQFHLRAHLGR